MNNRIANTIFNRMFKGAVWMPCFIEQSIKDIFGPEWNITHISDNKDLRQTYLIEGLCSISFTLDKMYEFNTVRSVKTVEVEDWQ